MSTPSRFLGIGVVLGLTAGLLVGVGLAQPGRASAASPSPLLPVVSGGVTVGAPGALPAVTTGGTTTIQSGTAQAGTAIAYPYFGGTPRVAPDHTIVVSGVGQADMKSDGSNRAAAQKGALADALADARSQADAIAAATGLSISGVLSVSASVSPCYGVMPMAGSTTGSGPNQPVPPIAPVPVPSYPQTLGVSVTVEYSVR
jgi:Protein of unknown function (DUF541)